MWDYMGWICFIALGSFVAGAIVTMAVGTWYTKKIQQEKVKSIIRKGE